MSSPGGFGGRAGSTRSGGLLNHHGTWVAIAVALSTIGGVLVSINPMLALAALFGSGLIAALVLRPVWGLPFLFLMLMVSDAMPTGVRIIVYLTLSKGATLAVVGAWFLRCTITRQFPLKANILWGPMIACWIVLLIGLVRAREIGSTAIQFSISFLLLIGLTQTLAAIDEPKRLRTVLLLIALIFVGVAVLGIPFGGANYTLEDYVRYRGFFQDPNEWSVALLLGIGPAVAILENRKNDLYRLVALVGVVAVVVNILRSVSRAGTLVTIITLPLLVVILWRRKWLLVAAAVTAVVVAVLYVDFEPLWIRFDSFFDAGEFETDGSMQTRSGLAEFALNAFMERPLLGLGTMSFYQDVMILSGGHYDKVVHNSYLQVLVEQGLIGSIPFVWLVGTVGYMVGRTWLNQKVKQIRRLTLGFMASFMAFGAMALTLDMLTFSAAWFWLGMLIIVDRVAQRSPAELLELGLADEDDPAVIADQERLELEAQAPRQAA